MSIILVVMRRTLIGLFALVSAFAFAQETDRPPLQDGFRDLRLGITLEEAKAALGVDPNFVYRGDPDVSLLPASRLPIIQTDGVAFIDQAILQFSNDRLYVLTLVLNEERLDYFTVFSEFRDRYGDPDRLEPGIAVWESDAVILSVEAPLTVKYVDAAAFSAIVEAGRMEQSLESMTRDRFLEQL